MDDFLAISERNTHAAFELIRTMDIETAWKTIGAEVRLVGSLRTGLLMKHRDIDFHIYSSPLRVEDSFAAMSLIASNPAVKSIQYGNLIDTDEHCIEWHAMCEDAAGELWQFDMIHILAGSQYDGYFERMADRISAVLTPETREAILRLKYETPDDEKIMGVEYYKAVIGDGVSTYDQFARWRAAQPAQGIVHWIP